MFHRLTVRKFFLLIVIILIFQLFLLGIIFKVSELPIQRLVGKVWSPKSFEPEGHHPCDITDAQALNAFRRMKDPECRRQGISIYCQIRTRNVWPQALESSCDRFDKSSFGKLLSCHPFGPEALERLSGGSTKTHNVFQLNGTTEPRPCLDLCLMIDFRLALYQRHSGYCICCDDLNWITDRPSSNLSIDCDSKCAYTSNLNTCPKDIIYAFSIGLQKVPYFLPSLDSTRDDHQNYIRPKIVFLLLVTGRSVLQVNRLLRNIYSPHHYYFIHVDSRDNYLFAKLLYLEEKFSNFALARNRSAPIWGAANLLTTILGCIGDIFHRWPNDWDFVLNLSETDFPIKQIDELERYLGHNYGRNFVKSHGKNAHDFVQTQALNRVFFQCEHHMWRIANRTLIKGIVWDGGSDWFILNRNFSHYLISSNDPVVTGLLRYFRYSLLPAESFFHVVLRNTQYCTTVVNNNLRATNWNRKLGCRCQHRHIVDWCGCSPNVFRLKDIPRLMATQTKPLFFARKFDPTIDGEIIDFVELRFLANNFQLEDLEEKLFMLNTYDRLLDYRPPAIWRLDFYRFFVRKSLELIRNNCSGSEVIETEPTIQEVNLLFKANHFYGTLIRFSGGDKSTEAEILLRRFSNETILLWKETKPRLKSVRVCTNFDEKEEIFRNYECLLNQEDQFQIYHEWEVFFGAHQIQFLFLDGRNKFRYWREITVVNNRTDATDLKLLFHMEKANPPPEPGLWKLIILNSENYILAVHRFIILENRKRNETMAPNLEKEKEPFVPNLRDAIDELITMNRIFFTATEITPETGWYIERVCLDDKTTNCYDFKSCRRQVSWSSWHQNRRWTL